MPESKNNFIGGRMNKDLDERLLQANEYRDARNIALSSSETGNSGSLETVAGTLDVSDFGLTDRNLECIGYKKDIEGGRIFMFITNYTDSSPTQLDNFAGDNSAHYIGCYNILTGVSEIIVKGNFLNFSKTHRIIQANIIEDLLFWTDNRNQPRKININTALGNASRIDTNPYYNSEESISVAKYYPWNPIKLYRFNEGVLNTYNHSLFDNITTLFDTASLAAEKDPPYSFTVGDGNLVTDSVNGDGASFEVYTDVSSNVSEILITAGGSGFEVGDTLTFTDPVGGVDEMVVTLRKEDFAIIPTMRDTTSKLLPYSATASANSWGTASSDTIVGGDTNIDLEKFDGCLIYVEDSDGVETTSISDGIFIDSITSIGTNTYNMVLSDTITIDSTDTVYIGANPFYNEDDIETISNLKDKFVRFAYRFKYDDNEYSLISPFTQSVFIPKQDGHFTGETASGGTYDADEQKTIESSNVAFFENKVTEVELLIDLPEGISTVAELYSEYKVREIDIIYKDANEPSLKVVKTLKENDIVADSSKSISYTYKSTKPIKVLPERELTRVSDKIPVRALAQETIGNRIVYANYLPKYESLDSFDFTVDYGNKAYQHENNGSFAKREYPNHTLKQNRTYQVGIVLSDKFGRKSDVITSDNSTLFSKYKDGDFDVMSALDVYNGDSIKLTFNESFPEETGNPLYRGIYDADTNPMGWYSYQVVVKQEEQSYHNIYSPTTLNGYPISSATDKDNDLAHVTLVGDNINKIPRDLESVSELDTTFRSDTNIYPRVITTDFLDTEHTNLKFDSEERGYKVVTIGTRDNLGLNTEESGTYYGGVANAVSPIFKIPEAPDGAGDGLLLGANPLIARVSTPETLGAQGGNATVSDLAYNNVDLNVFETRPQTSNLDIYWETSTAGLISEINQEVLAPENSEGLPYQISDFQFTFSESSAVNDIVSSEFTIQDFGGNDILNVDTDGTLLFARNKNNDVFNNLFLLEKNTGNNKFYLRYISQSPVYYGDSSWRDETYDLVFRFSNVVDGETVSRNIVLKDNAMINEEPTFAEAGTRTSDSLATVGNVATAVDSNGVTTIGWREVSDITISNGSSFASVDLKELRCDINSVEWLNTNDSQWYNYWYFDTLSFGATRKPEGLVKVVFTDQTNPKSIKILYSPLLQWGWFDRSPFTPSFQSTLLAAPILEYFGETPVYLSNINTPSSSLPIPASRANDNSILFNYHTNNVEPLNSTIVSGLIANNGVVPSSGIQDNSQNASQGQYFVYRNVVSEPINRDPMDVRVNFTLFDANRNGISKNFTAYFKVNYGGFSTFDDTI